MPDTLCFSVVVPRGLAAESQLAREGSGWKQGAKSAPEPRAPGAGNGGRQSLATSVVSTSRGHVEPREGSVPLTGAWQQEEEPTVPASTPAPP